MLNTVDRGHTETSALSRARCWVYKTWWQRFVVLNCLDTIRLTTATTVTLNRDDGPAETSLLLTRTMLYDMALEALHRLGELTRWLYSPGQPDLDVQTWQVNTGDPTRGLTGPNASELKLKNWQLPMLFSSTTLFESDTERLTETPAVELLDSALQSAKAFDELYITLGRCAIQVLASSKSFPTTSAWALFRNGTHIETSWLCRSLGRNSANLDFQIIGTMLIRT